MLNLPGKLSYREHYNKAMIKHNYNLKHLPNKSDKCDRTI